jgi:hypothetical protein
MTVMGYGRASQAMLRMMAGIPGYNIVVIKYSPEVIEALSKLPGPANKPVAAFRGTDGKNYAVGNGVVVCDGLR